MANSEALFEAVAAKDAMQVEKILDTKPELVAIRNHQGLTPLLMAVYHGADEVVELLRKRGSRLDVFEAAALGEGTALRNALEDETGAVNRKGPDGFTPLHLASFFGRSEAVSWLLERGADPGAWSDNEVRNQALHASIAGARSHEIVRRLLASGADVNATGGGGYTPLHLACSRGDAPLVEELLRRGAEIRPTDDGRTPAQIARDYGHPQVVELLVGLSSQGQDP
ncbi:MAG: ankyrin repeat domain-containing protein [Gemmatimonas sp.]|nr:ankyrin repeat domain-containing protein [Gemmatimonas sp.]